MREEKLMAVIEVSKWTYPFLLSVLGLFSLGAPVRAKIMMFVSDSDEPAQIQANLGHLAHHKSPGPPDSALALVKPARAPPTRPHTNKRTPMAAAGNGETTAPPPPQQEPSPAPAAGAASGGGVIAALEEQWRKTREHAETYPYVWGSYILVYGGLGAYLAWRWGKLRRTEDRVRILQERLRKLAAAEESQAAPGSASTTPTPPPPPPQQPAAGPAKPASGP
jgi:hypothetical protein